MSRTKGFTLIESLFILSMIALAAMLFPVLSPAQKHLEKHNVLLLHQFLLESQGIAMKQHQCVEIILQGHYASNGIRELYLDHLNMMPISFHFNEKGHISRALTISFYNSETKLIAQLGSGSLAIR